MKSNMSGNIRICKALVFVILLVGFTLFCSVGVLKNGGSKIKTKLDLKAKGSLKNMEVMGRLNGDHQPKVDFYFMSKRRVPNGPDPIHNRRAGNSRRPPGQD